MQLRAEHIDLSAIPLPKPSTAPELFLVTVELAGATVRPRVVDFIVAEEDARKLYRLHQTGRHSVKFAMEATGRRFAFLNIESVRFDFDLPKDPMYTVGAIHKIAKFRI